MGKGDQKTKRGKITRGSYGKTRPRKKTTGTEVSIKEKVQNKKAAQPEKTTEEIKETKPKTTRAKKTTEEPKTPKPKATKTKKTGE